MVSTPNESHAALEAAASADFSSLVRSICSTPRYGRLICGPGSNIIGSLSVTGPKLLSGEKTLQDGGSEPAIRRCERA